MKEYNIKKWKEYGLITLDDNDVNILSKQIGNTRGGYSYNSKPLPAMTAAVIQTLYKLGPELTMRPKDMVNDTTRLAYLIDTVPALSVKTLPKRGQVSCGHDEFEGKAYLFYQVEYNLNYDKGRYSQHAWNRIGKGELVRADNLEEMEKLRKEHYLKEQTRLLEKYDLVDFKIPEGVERTDEMWLNKHLYDALYSSYDSYRGFMRQTSDDKYGYKGECAWKGEKDKLCSFHQGIKHENVLVTQTGTRLDEIVVNGNVINKLTGLSDWLQTKCSDERVIKAIKKVIPKMKTESRDWLMSTWAGKDEEGRWVGNLHGIRGHYKLTWWGSIERDKKAQADSIIYKAREGTLLNGWKFITKSDYHDGNFKGEWLPITPLKKYAVSYGTSTYHNKKILTTFDRDTAEQLVQFITSIKPNIISDRMVVEGKVIVPQMMKDIRVEEKVLEIYLKADADPSKYTPTQALALVRSGDGGHRYGDGDINTDMYIEGGK